MDALMELMEHFYASKIDFDRDTFVRILVAVRDARVELATFGRDVESELMAHAGEKRWVTEGVGEVEVKKKTKRTGWKHDELVSALIARIMDEPETIFDRDTGELLPYVQIGHNLTNRLRHCISFGAGKMTGLRAIGMQPDEWCKEEADGYSVVLP